MQGIMTDSMSPKHAFAVASDWGVIKGKHRLRSPQDPGQNVRHRTKGTAEASWIKAWSRKRRL